MCYHSGRYRMYVVATKMAGTVQLTSLLSYGNSVSTLDQRQEVVEKWDLLESLSIMSVKKLHTFYASCSREKSWNVVASTQKWRVLLCRNGSRVDGITGLRYTFSGGCPYVFVGPNMNSSAPNYNPARNSQHRTSNVYQCSDRVVHAPSPFSVKSLVSESFFPRWGRAVLVPSLSVFIQSSATS